MSKHFLTSLAAISVPGLVVGKNNSSPAADANATPWERIAVKVTIGTEAIEIVVRYSKANGEAQLSKAASTASLVRPDCHPEGLSQPDIILVP